MVSRRSLLLDFDNHSLNKQTKQNKMIQQTSMIIILMMMVILLPDLFESKCWQKNTKREANRDQYICRNQLFEPGQKIVDPENCDCYYDCNYRQQPCYSCCPNGQVFSAKQNDCVLRSAFQCQNQPLRYRCEGRGLFRNLEHCRKYWDCRNSNVDDEPVEEACPDDYHWDDQKKICRKDSEILPILRTCNDN